MVQFHYESHHWLTETVKELTKDATRHSKTISTLGASYDIDLPKFDGPIVTRFPPGPSSYLHIGHAKAALLNDYFIHNAGHRGTLICRVYNTNPSKESIGFQKAIIMDLELMHIYPDKVLHSSDYFQPMFELTIQLIKDGKAFADDSVLGRGNEDRKNRLPTGNREMSVDETSSRGVRY